MKSAIGLVAGLLAAVLLPAPSAGQVTVEDYRRAQQVREKYRNLAADIAGPATWIGESSRFWYRKSVVGGAQFIVADAETLEKRPAFDHEKLAAAISKLTGEKIGPLSLPFTEFSFEPSLAAIRFAAGGSEYRCNLEEYTCTRTGNSPQTGAFRRGRPPEAWEDSSESPAEFPNNVADGMVLEPPQQQQEQRQQELVRSNFGPLPEPVPVQVRASPDGAWEALIHNFNVLIRRKGERTPHLVSYDGNEGDYYTFSSLTWSPDSKRLVAYRVRPGYRRLVHFVESSPADQLQPKHYTREYAKPGDVLDVARPVLFDVAAGRQIVIDDSLFPNPYSLSRAVWWKDSRGFTFEYNERGHQVYRVLEVDAATGACRSLITEESKTFIDYRPLVPNPRDTGKKFRYDIADGKEILWASERDGWEHLYLYDGTTGRVKNQITKGEWVVRAVDFVDEERRQIWFQASGMYPGKDPYFVHHYRINFDGTGLVAFTEADADHTVRFSPNRRYYVDVYSRPDLPTVAELRRTEDRKLLLTLEKGDITALVEAGWRAPEPFVAKGRDGKTDIWGLIYKPANFDPSKRYPVVEAVYAGPQGSFVPKSFSPLVQPLTELGFVVAQIDGMGTNNRSKAFHDVAWRNLKDGGFPDRILWHRAVAAKYPWYDISRVGVFGNSAGGQNALAALLFHGDFYKAAVSNSGCHDNRMDKIWWNEQWMGWPLGPHYAESSNVENAHRLQGALLLIVGELDTNVDPASTLQVVNALIKAGKRFDLLFVPGGGHGAGGAYGQRLLQDFFVRHLHGVEPPDWNRMPENILGNQPVP